jgi:hypothetical protein
LNIFKPAIFLHVRTAANIADASFLAGREHPRQQPGKPVFGPVIFDRIASAFRWPINTTSFFPRVMPV